MLFICELKPKTEHTEWLDRLKFIIIIIIIIITIIIIIIIVIIVIIIIIIIIINIIWSSTMRSPFFSGNCRQITSRRFKKDCLQT